MTIRIPIIKGRIVSSVEAEYGLPFWDVVKQYADDGESINATAYILGYQSATHFYQMVKRNGLQHWFKKDRESNGWIASMAGNKRGKPTEAGRINAGKATKALHAVEAFGIMDSLKGHSIRHGMAPTTVRWRIQRNKWSLEKALTEPLRCVGKISLDHPWHIAERESLEAYKRKVSE